MSLQPTKPPYLTFMNLILSVTRRIRNGQYRLNVSLFSHRSSDNKPNMIFGRNNTNKRWYFIRFLEKDPYDSFVILFLLYLLTMLKVLLR